VDETSVAVKVEEVSPIKTKLLFDVPWNDVKKQLDALYREVGKTAKVKGFRAGKIPRNILEIHYKDYVEGETIAKLVERYYLDALKSHNILAVNQPDIEQQGLEKDKNFTFTATVEVEPPLEPKGYTNLELERIERQVTDKDVDTRLEEFRNMFATMEDVKEERGVATGDFATLNFHGSIDGVEKKELQGEKVLLEVGTKRFIPGFEEALLGMAKGETKEFPVSFPEDYYVPDIAGKDALFTVTVESVKEKKLPLLDPSFIENFQKYKSLEELKDDIRKSLEEQFTNKSQSDFQNLLISELLKNNEFEVPPSYVEREYQYMLADAQRRMAMDGMSREDASEMSRRYEDQYRQAAERVVKVASLLKRIASKEAIAVEDSEIEERIREIAEQSRDLENSRKYLESDAVKENIRQELLSKKVLKYIEDNSHITVVKKEADDIEEESK